MNQLVDDLLVGPGRGRFKLVARSTEAGAPQQVRHQREPVIRHFFLLHPQTSRERCKSLTMVGCRTRVGSVDSTNPG